MDRAIGRPCPRGRSHLRAARPTAPRTAGEATSSRQLGTTHHRHESAARRATYAARLTPTPCSRGRSSPRSAPEQRHTCGSRPSSRSVLLGRERPWSGWQILPRRARLPARSRQPRLDADQRGLLAHLRRAHRRRALSAGARTTAGSSAIGTFTASAGMSRVPLRRPDRVGERGTAAHLRAHDARYGLLLGRDVDVAARWPRAPRVPVDAASSCRARRPWPGVSVGSFTTCGARRLRRRLLLGRRTPVVRWATERRTAAPFQPRRVGPRVRSVERRHRPELRRHHQRRRILLGRRLVRSARCFAVGCSSSVAAARPCRARRSAGGLRRAAVHRDQRRVSAATSAA